MYRTLQRFRPFIDFARATKVMTPFYAFQFAILLNHKSHNTLRSHVVKFTLREFGTLFVRRGTSDVSVLNQVLVLREYDLSGTPQFEMLYETYRAAADAGRQQLIIDCGANIGLSTLFFARKFPNAKVLAIEPAVGNVTMAMQNLSGIKNIEFINAAIDSRPGTLTLKRTGEEWGYRTSPPTNTADGPLVIAMTIDQLCAKTAIEDILIVKVDIEGAERSLFVGDVAWMDRVSLLIVELHDWLFPGEGTSRAFFRALEGRKFEMLHRGENLFFFFEK